MEAKQFNFSALVEAMVEVRRSVDLVWIDIETGGFSGQLENGELGSSYYPILEVAVKVMDRDFNLLTDPLCIAIYQDEASIAKCSEWALKTHTESGLLKRVREDGISLEDAEDAILSQLASIGIAPYNRKAQSGGVLAGNGINFEHMFFACQMPKLNAYLDYREMNVSAFNVAALMWNKKLYTEAREAKQYKHEAMADINESIDEMKLYLPLIEEQGFE